MQSDTYTTGKLYPKLDAYFESHRIESKGTIIYLGSSCQFRTQKSYKAWLLGQYEGFKKIIIKRAE